MVAGMFFLGTMTMLEEHCNQVFDNETHYKVIGDAIW